MNASAALILSVATTIFALAQATGSAGPGPRIVNGTTAAASQFPYQVSLRAGLRPKHFCAGAIIADRWILTAAQCTAGRRPQSLVAVVGSVSLSSGGSTYRIHRIHPHPSYSASDFNFDIALMRTAKQIKFNKVVQPIGLPRAGILRPYSHVIISGWGRDSGNFRQLQYLDSTTISPSECKRLVPSVNQSLSSLVCHQHERGGACVGDNGKFEFVRLLFDGRGR